MKPTPSKLKKFLLPGVIIVGLVLVGVLLFMNGGTVDQGAALFNATRKTASVQTGVAGSLATNTQPLPCLAGSTTPKIKVMSPNGGQTYHPGNSFQVTWSTCNIASTDKIELHLDRLSSTGAVTSNYQLMLLVSGWPGTAWETTNAGQATVILPASTAGNSLFWGANGYPFGPNYKITVFHNNVATGWFDKDSSDGIITINP